MSSGRSVGRRRSRSPAAMRPRRPASGASNRSAPCGAAPASAASRSRPVAGARPPSAISELRRASIVRQRRRADRWTAVSNGRRAAGRERRLQQLGVVGLVEPARLFEFVAADWRSRAACAGRRGRPDTRRRCRTLARPAASPGGRPPVGGGAAPTGRGEGQAAARERAGATLHRARPESCVGARHPALLRHIRSDSSARRRPRVNPVDVLRRVLDVAGLAVHAVLRVDLQPRLAGRRRPTIS